MRHLPREGSARAVRLHSQHQLRGCFPAIRAGLRSKMREICSQLWTMNMRSARWTTMGNVTSPPSQPVTAPTPIFDPSKGAFTSSEMQIRKPTGPTSCTSRAGRTPCTDTHNRIDHVRTPEAAIDKGAPQGLRSGGGAFGISIESLTCWAFRLADTWLRRSPCDIRNSSDGLCWSAPGREEASPRRTREFRSIREAPARSKTSSICFSHHRRAAKPPAGLSGNDAIFARTMSIRQVPVKPWQRSSRRPPNGGKCERNDLRSSRTSHSLLREASREMLIAILLGFRSLAVTASVARTNEGNGDGNATERPHCGAQGSGGRPRAIPPSAGAGRSYRKRSAATPTTSPIPRSKVALPTWTPLRLQVHPPLSGGDRRNRPEAVHDLSSQAVIDAVA
jgi:hypothetical protein